MGKGFFVGALFAAVWCGLTGLGVYETLRTIARCVDAQRRFVPVDATILDSRLVRAGKRGDKLEVRFSYKVDGWPRIATGPAFGSTSSSFERGDPARYPVGSRVTAWVDPDRPDVAVLDRRVPEDTWWACVLLQPFITVGLAFLAGLIRGPFNVRREKAFLREDGFLPWKVPGWGTLVGSGDVRSIHRPAAAFTAAGMAWGLSTFAAAFLLGMSAAAFEFRLAFGMPVTLAACGLVSAAFYLRSRRRGGHTVTVDGPGRRVIVGTSTIPWSNVRSLRAIRQESVGRRGMVYRGVRLALVDDLGGEHVLNEFMGCEDDAAVAERIGRHLAELIKAPFDARSGAQNS